MAVLRAAVGILISFGMAAATHAEEQPLPRELAAFAEAVTRERPIPPALVASLQSWTEPAEPFKIVGPIHYVGTKGLAAYLISTPKGHILLDGGMPMSGKDFEASIRKLGFRPEDIRLLLVTHAHIDHAGTTAYFKKLSNAEVVVMDREVELLASGGNTDFRYGDQPAFRFPAVTADRQIKDGETVSLGKVKMIARLGAGHTKGATTWIAKVEDGGKSYDVVFPCCMSVNTGYRLIVDPSYAGIADDYARTAAMLQSLKPDIWLPAHTEAFGLEGKSARAAKEGVEAWVDPDGYAAWLARQKTAFEQALAKEKLLGAPEGAFGLAGTSWRLVRFQGMDDTSLTPDDPSKYTLEFQADGKLAVRVDCNRGAGTWKSEEPNQLELGPLALTRMACPPAPMSDRILKDWSYVRSYVLKNSHLFVALMADGGIYEFEPLEKPKR